MSTGTNFVLLSDIIEMFKEFIESPEEIIKQKSIECMFRYNGSVIYNALNKIPESKNLIDAFEENFIVIADQILYLKLKEILQDNEKINAFSKLGDKWNIKTSNNRHILYFPE